MVKGLNEGAVLKALADGAILINVVTEAAYENFYLQGNYVVPFIPESIPFLLEVIDASTPIIIGREEDAKIIEERFQEVGYSNILGYTDFDVHKWIMEQPDMEMLLNMDQEEFGIDIKHQQDAIIIDLRNEEECAAGYAEKALNIPIDLLEEKAALLKDQKQIYLYCADGFRSMVASCILKNKGYINHKNSLAGFNDFNPEHIKITKPKKAK